MTFDNTLTHPFFNQPDVLKADILEIAEEYRRAFEHSSGQANGLSSERQVEMVSQYYPNK